MNAFVGLWIFTAMLHVKPHFFSMSLVDFHITRLVVTFTLILVLLQSNKTEKFKLFESSQGKWLLIFCIFMVLSLITSIWKGKTVNELVSFTKIGIAFFLILNLITSKKRFRSITWAIVLSASYVCIFSILHYYQSGDMFNQKRMVGYFPGAHLEDPNGIALGLIMLLPFLYFDLFRKSSFFLKTLQVSIIGLFLCAIVFTQSRGGLLGLCVMFFVFWLKSKRKFAIAVLVFFVLCGGWILSPPAYKDRMMSISTAADDDAAAISRLDAWEAGARMMSHYLFGVGIGNFGEGFVIYRSDTAVDHIGTRRTAHNMYMLVGGETGAFGLIVFIMLLTTALKKLNKIKSQATLNFIKEKNQSVKEIILLSDATYISLIGFCAGGMFLSQAYDFMLYYLLAFSVVIENLYLKNRNQEVNGRVY